MEIWEILLNVENKIGKKYRASNTGWSWDGAEIEIMDTSGSVWINVIKGGNRIEQQHNNILPICGQVTEAYWMEI